MRYGEKLRECRVARGWSRERLARRVNHDVTAEGIEAIEIGRSIFPFETTRMILGLAMPELADWEREFMPAYAKERKAHVSQA